MGAEPVFDSNGSPGAIQLGTPIVPLDLPIGASTTLSIPVVVPPGTQAGNYWFGVDVDITNNIGVEASKENNFAITAAPTLVEQPNKPDLRLSPGSWTVQNDPLPRASSRPTTPIASSSARRPV
ncbi:MAG: hypothetical protein R3F34_02050 [Planctomycetota bacterium]